jgi:hypothetical protein
VTTCYVAEREAIEREADEFYARRLDAAYSDPVRIVVLDDGRVYEENTLTGKRTWWPTETEVDAMIAQAGSTR